MNACYVFTHGIKETIESQPVANEINNASPERNNDKLACQVLFLLRRNDISVSTTSLKFSARPGDRSSSSSCSMFIFLYCEINRFLLIFYRLFFKIHSAAVCYVDLPPTSLLTKQRCFIFCMLIYQSERLRFNRLYVLVDSNIVTRRLIIMNAFINWLSISTYIYCIFI